MSARSTWKRAHHGKRSHRTFIGAVWHCIRIRVKYGDRLDPYRCMWTDDHKTNGRPHYHAGHSPGFAPTRKNDPRTEPRRAIPSPTRQMILGFNELQMSTLRSRAAAHQMPWQRYAATIVHTALAQPVPRHSPPMPEEILVSLGYECPVCGDTYHDLPGHFEDNFKGCADLLPSHVDDDDPVWNMLPAKFRPVERCPVHAEPVGDGRHCIACDGGVF